MKEIFDVKKIHLPTIVVVILLVLLALWLYHRFVAAPQG